MIWSLSQVFHSPAAGTAFQSAAGTAFQSAADCRLNSTYFSTQPAAAPFFLYLTSVSMHATSTSS